jgi:hypothetical protein
VVEKPLQPSPTGIFAIYYPIYSISAMETFSKKFFSVKALRGAFRKPLLLCIDVVAVVDVEA